MNFKAYKKQLIWFWSIFFGGVLMVFIFFVAISEWELFGALPSFEELENPNTNQAAEIYSSDRVLLGTFFKENRSNIEYGDLSPYLVAALIATEDERFHEHSGIDPRALARAVQGMGSAGGGSTLTQQLAKLLFTERPSDNIFTRVIQKLKEWVIAVKLERHYTKDEILTMYLNKLDFVNNAVGIKSAARIYFSTTAAKLTLEQSAMLVGMAKNPALFNPIRRGKKTCDRRNVVMFQMVRNSKLEKPLYDSLKILPLSLKLSLASHTEGPATYFREELRKYMTKWCQQHVNPSTGENYDLYRDGLRIYTTINSKMQVHAENAVKSHLGGELQAKFFSHWNNKTGIMKKMAPFYFSGLGAKEYEAAVNKIIIDGIRSSARYNKELDRNSNIRELLRKYNKYLEPQNELVEKKGMLEEKRYYYQTQVNNLKKDTSTSEETVQRLAAYRDSAEIYAAQKEEIKEDIEDLAEGVQRSWKAYQSAWKPFDDSMMVAFNKPVKTKLFSWKGDFDTIISLRDSVRYAKKYLQTGLLSVDPATGYIKAWVGGINYKHYQYDHVSQGRRQVGSTFKAFVYATAIENGISPCEKVLNIPVTFPAGMYGLQGSWTPKNSAASILDGEAITLKMALANSINSISAYFMKQYGPAAVIDVARRCGIASPLESNPAICLGTADLSLKEMVAAYASFANKGTWKEPTFILRIEDKNGNIIYTPNPGSREAMSEESAYKMVELLSGVAAYGPMVKGQKTYGTGVRLRNPAKPYGGIPYSIKIAGKTGTTQNQSDGWFMGITPDVVTGVWVGCDDRSAHFTSLQLGMGTNTALPIWGYYMNSLWKDQTLKVSKGSIPVPESLRGENFNCEELQGTPNFNDIDDKLLGEG